MAPRSADVVCRGARGRASGTWSLRQDTRQSLAIGTPAPSVGRDGGKVQHATTIRQPDRPSGRWPHLEVRQRNEATDVIVRVSESLPVELDPRMGQKFAGLSAHSHAHDCAANSSTLQQARESHRPDQALRTKNAEARSPDNREREATCFRHPSRVGSIVRGSGNRCRERAHRARAHGHVRREKRRLCLDEVQPLPRGESKQLLRDVSRHKRHEC
jgi:hypothetical protein